MYRYLLNCVAVLFVCLFRVYRPFENFSLIWRRHHYRWRAANCDLCSALTAIDISEDQWHSHILSSVKHIYELSLPVFTTKVRKINKWTITSIFNFQWDLRGVFNDLNNPNRFLISCKKIDWMNPSVLIISQ